MKKQDKTFAQRAREIKNKYKRADYDNIEKQEMIAELRKLRDEQEQFRVDSGIAEKEEQESEYGTGGLFDDPSLTVKDEDLSSFKAMKPDVYSTPTSSILPTAISGGVYSSWGNKAYVPLNALGKNITGANAPNTLSLSSDVKDAYVPEGPTFSSPNSSILPTAISAGFSFAGNAIGMYNANRQKNKNISLPRMAPSEISLENERQALNRRYDSAINTMLANTRTGNNADRIAAYTSLTNSLGDSMSQSYMNEANANAQFRQQANATNADLGSKEIMYNAERRDKYNAERSQYRDAMFNTIPMALRDYREQVNNDNLLGVMGGSNYGLYYQNPVNETFMERLKRNMLGNNYQILPREYVRQLNGLQ